MGWLNERQEEQKQIETMNKAHEDYEKRQDLDEWYKSWTKDFKTSLEGLHEKPNN